MGIKGDNKFKKYGRETGVNIQRSALSFQIQFKFTCVPGIPK